MYTYNGASAAPTSAPVPKSPWHSPVPYLFGGLAAMLGLIAFALLILACSYWKLSGYLQHDGNGAERDLEAGEGGAGDDGVKVVPVMEEKFLVIMAGQEKPTFIATPASSRTTSFEREDTCPSEENCAVKKTEEDDRRIGPENLDGEDSGPAADQVH